MSMQLTLADELKRKGIEQVAGNAEPWTTAVICLIRAMVTMNPEITSDEVRDAAEAAGLGSPHHSNAWGAVMNAAARQGVIKKTGAYKKSRRPKNHSAVLAVWRAA